MTMLQYFLSKLTRPSFEQGYNYGYEAGKRSVAIAERTDRKEVRTLKKNNTMLAKEVARLRLLVADMPQLPPKPAIDFPETDIPLPPMTVKQRKKISAQKKHAAVIAHHQRKKLRKKLKQTVGFCIYCGLDADTLDHLIPKARGGTDDPGNLALACSSCNALKGMLTYDEFIKTKNI